MKKRKETTRDRDARAAMAALARGWAEQVGYPPTEVTEDAGAIARGAFVLADAMQAERERRDHEGEGKP